MMAMAVGAMKLIILRLKQSIHRLMQFHPTVCFPKDVKETMFFDQYYQNGLRWYEAHFAHRREEQFCGEIGPTYFDEKFVPKRIHQVNAACRIIINLRNPIDRAQSLYHLHFTRGRTNCSFAEASLQIPRILDSGTYSQHIPRWLDVFGANQVSIVLLDDIKLQPAAVLKRIYDFLDVPEVEMPDLGYQKIAAPTMPRSWWIARLAVKFVNWLHARRLHNAVNLGKRLGLNKFVYTGGKQELPRLATSDKLELLKIYEPDIAFVENLLGRDLSAWRQIS